MFSLAILRDEDYAKISTLSQLEECERPSMVIVDDAQFGTEPNLNFTRKLRRLCQAAKIPLIAIGTIAMITFLPSASIHQLWPLSIDETKEFSAQARLECGLTLGQGVVDAIHNMSGGDVGFLGIVGDYLTSTGWCGKTFEITDYYRAFHKDLRSLLLGERGVALDGLLFQPTLVPYLCYAKRLTEKGMLSLPRIGIEPCPRCWRVFGEFVGGWSVGHVGGIH